MTTIAVGVFGVGLMVVGSLAYWRMSSAVNDLERSQYGNLASAVRGRIERLVSRDRSRLKEAAFSDDLYTLVARGPAPPDSFIHPAFVDLFPRLYQDEFIGIYDLQGNRLLVWNDGVHDLEAVAVANPLLRVLDNREPAAGLVRRGDDLFWVAGVPILPTNYRDVTQPISGYLVVAHAFDPGTLASLVGGPAASLRVRPMASPKTPFRSVVNPTAGGDSAVVQFALADIFAQQNTLAELSRSRGEFRAVERSFRWAFLLAAVAVISLIIGAWWLAQRWLVAPASRLAAALEPVHRGQIPALVSAPSDGDEWTGVTAALNRLLANLRGSQDRFERVLRGIRDGVWEQEFASGEWYFSSRFHQLLGLEEGELGTSLQSLERLLHPEDRERVLSTLHVSSGTARTVDLEVRLKRKGGAYGSYRLRAIVLTDQNGGPVRFSGSLFDLEPEGRAAAAVSEIADRASRTRRAYGRLLAALGPELRTSSPTRADLVETVGQGFGGALGVERASFDLQQLVRDTAGRAPVDAEVTFLPGVPNRVMGDQEQIRRVLAQLVANAAHATIDRRIAVHVDHPSRASADLVRFTVEDNGRLLANEERQRILDPLLAGEPPESGPPGLGLLLVHEIVEALGGAAGAEFRPAGGAKIWFTIPLPEVKEDFAASAITDFGAESPAFWAAGDSDSTFTLDDAGQRPSRPSLTMRPSLPVELVADATVMIDLDGPEPIKRKASSAPGLVKQLEAGGKVAHLAAQMATTFLQDAPVRLRELRGAFQAGEPDTAAAAAVALKGMASLIGASDLAAQCQAIEAGAKNEMPTPSSATLDEIARELDRIRSLLEPALGQPASAPDARPPVDPSTLEQIRSSLATDGRGLGTQLVSLFLAEVPPKLEGLERAVRGTDRAATRSIAADLKGMCSLVGARPMGELCEALVDQAPGEAAVRSLKAEYLRVQSALEELLGARSGA